MNGLEKSCFNPYTGKYEPLTIWTNLTVKDGPDGTSRYKYDPIGDNVTSEVKDDKRILNTTNIVITIMAILLTQTMLNKVLLKRNG